MQSRISIVLSTLALGLTAAAQSEDVYTGPVGNGPLPPAPSVQLPTSQNLAVLLDNGLWITQTGVGAGGADVSEVFTAAGQTLYGSNCSVNAGYAVADDFTVPAGQTWTITDVVFRSYQTGSSTTSTFTGARMQMWSGGAPNAGGAVSAGDWTTERYVGSVFSNVYRVLDTGLLNTQRPVMDVTINGNFIPPAGSGTYWLQMGTIGTLASGPWSNPTEPPAPSANALQLLTTNTWQNLVNGGVNTDLPYIINGTGGGGCPAPTTYCTAKTSSSGCVPAMGFTGSATPAGNLTATGSNIEVGQLGVLFYGTSGPAASPFQGGFLCVAPPVVRFPVQPSGGAAACTGSYSQSLASLISPAGTTYHVQWWFRDPGAASGTGLSDGGTFTTCP